MQTPARSTATAEPVPGAPAPRTAGKVLIIDDDATMRLLAATTLRRYGLQVSEAASGLEGLRTLRNGDFSIVVLDVRMPDMDGFEVCERIRAEVGDIPVLIVSGRQDAAWVQRAYECGANDFLAKPVNWFQVYNKVGQMASSLETSARLEHALAEQQTLVGIIPDTLVRMGGDGAVEDIIVGEDCPAVLKSALERGGVADVRAARLGRILRECAFSDGESRFELEDADGVRYFRARSQRTGASGHLVIIRNVTSERRNEKRLETLAYVDENTGLGNRAWIRDRYSMAVEAARRSGRHLEVYRILVENAAGIRELFGEDSFEMVLAVLARRLQSHCSALSYHDSSAAVADVEVARSGDGEFALLRMTGPVGADDADYAGQLATALGRIIRVGNLEVSLHLKIGVASAAPGEVAGNDLFQLAGVAALEAVAPTAAGVCRSDHALQRLRIREFKLEAQLRRALEEGEIRLNYQPQFDIGSGALTGFEALCRWTHKGTPVSPGEFIPVAESSGLIQDIGERTLEIACSQIAAWRAAGLAVPRIAVNLSPVQLVHGNVVECLQQKLACHGLGPDALELEITETALLESSEGLQRTLQQLRGAGIKIALDDFGTGYSSLAYLNEHPLDLVKIDRMFVSDLSRAERSDGIVRAIVAMSRALGMEVIAEGVETQAQLSFLDGIGCDYVQGFLTGRPQSPEQAATLLASI